MQVETEEQYEEALKEVSKYFDKEPERDSEEGLKFEKLLVSIKEYEDIHYPIIDD